MAKLVDALQGVQPTPRSFDWWLRMSRGYVASATDEQHHAIAQLCVETDCGVWHAAATVGNAARCWCARCLGGPRIEDACHG